MQKYLYIAIATFLLGAGISLFTSMPTKTSLGDTNSLTTFALGNATSASCLTSSTLAIATSTGARLGLRMYNDSPNGIYLALGQAAVLHTGIFLSASSTVELKDPIYEGAVYCISGATSALSIEEIK